MSDPWVSYWSHMASYIYRLVKANPKHARDASMCPECLGSGVAQRGEPHTCRACMGSKTERL